MFTLLLRHWTKGGGEHMAKQIYYVVPQTREIMNAPDADEFEFEIEATEAEVHQLQEVLNSLDSNDFSLLFDGHLWMEKQALQHNHNVDDALFHFYRQVFALGTPRTQEQLKQLQIIDNMEGT